MEDLFQEIEDEDNPLIEDQPEFPLYVKLKTGGFIKLDADGDFLFISKRNCTITFQAGNHYIEDILDLKKRGRAIKELAKAYKRVNTVITKEEFEKRIHQFNSDIEGFVSGELKQVYLAGVGQFRDEESNHYIDRQKVNVDLLNKATNSKYFDGQ